MKRLPLIAVLCLVFASAQAQQMPADVQKRVASIIDGIRLSKAKRCRFAASDMRFARSVDGGRTWGKLGNLRMGGRYATPEDVTHVRWRIAPGHAARGSGHIAYSGIVR